MCSRNRSSAHSISDQSATPGPPRFVLVPCTGHTLPTAITGLVASQEDGTLLRLVRENGAQQWSDVAASLPGRVAKQCRER